MPKNLKPTSATRPLAVAVGLVLLGGSLVAVAPEAEAVPICSSFTSKVYDQLTPDGRQSLSSNVANYVAAQSSGFSVSRPFRLTAAPGPSSGLRAVRRLYRASNKDLFYSLDAGEIRRARALGYRDQGVAFYASPSKSSCLQAVRSYYRPGGFHRFLPASENASALIKAGWRQERVRFYLGKPADASVFTIAVYPDTQQEVLDGRDRRFAQRSEWLVKNRRALDLRFATHVGDVVNWDTEDHAQYLRAQAGLAPLRGYVPYSLTPGNHDTNAVGVGGGAADPKRTRILVRETPSFNRYLNQGTRYLAGRFEPGKVDNTYSTFTAQGLRWLVMNLEFCPRRPVVAWANKIVAAHPRHNVIVTTHSYINSAGAISPNAEYGDSSPRYLFDSLIKRHSNIRIVLSGHAGRAGMRQDRGLKGNVITTLWTTMHDNRTNPVRIIEINARAGTLSSAMYAPFTSTTYPQFRVAPHRVGWTR